MLHHFLDLLLDWLLKDLLHMLFNSLVWDRLEMGWFLNMLDYNGSLLNYFVVFANDLLLALLLLLGHKVELGNLVVIL